MKMIHPYGKSVVEKNKEDTNLDLRKIQPGKKRDNNPSKHGDNPSYDLEEFYLPSDCNNVLAEEKDLISVHMATWISVIDKIYRKPNKKDFLKYKSSKEVVKLHESSVYKREALGNECWPLFEEYLKNLGVTLSEENRAEWNSKIHSYDQKTKTSYIEKNSSYKGKWHALYQKDASETAQRIKTHIYENAHSIKGEPVNKRKGLFAHRTTSIRKSVAPLFVKKDNDAYEKALDTSKDVLCTTGLKAYGYNEKSNTDIVKKIYKDYCQLSKKKKKGDLCVAMDLLREHYVLVFGKTPWTKVPEEKKEALRIHATLKDYYKGLFRGDRRLSNLVKRLPKDMSDMKCKLGQIRQNRDVNYYIRLGKVIHYTLSGEWDNWQSKIIPEALENSFYRTSNGQHRIKQSEAFVKMWLTCISNAALTLRSFFDPTEEVFSGDIIGGDENKIWRGLSADKQTKIIENYPEKLPFLFGEKQHLFRFDGKEELQKDFVRFTLNFLAQIRHASFHFKGAGKFCSELKSSEVHQCLPEVKKVFQILYTDDQKQRNNKIKETLKALSVQFYLEKEEVEIILDKICCQNEATLVLPKFSKMLQRIENIKNFEGFYLKKEEVEIILDKICCQNEATLVLPKLSKMLQRIENIKNFERFYLKKEEVEIILDKICYQNEATLVLPKLSKMLQRIENIKNFERLKLPNAPHRTALEEGNLKLQYTVLKMIYEKPFRIWLEDNQSWKGYAKKALDRTKEAAENMNGEQAIARAATLHYENADSLSDLFYDLSHHTAKAMRVQKAYDSDKKQAKKQSKYIEDFKCDIIGQAFSAYLENNELAFMKGSEWRKDTDSQDETKDERKEKFDIQQLPLPTDKADDGEDWEAFLYYALHFIPVEDINLLQHQVRKWLVVTEKSHTGTHKEDKTFCENLLKVMTLYSDMHDAKFIDNASIDIHENFKQCYECPDTLEKVFPKADDKRSDSLIPKRGLREMLRYGDMKIFKPIFKDHEIQIKDDMYKQWKKLEESIAEKQKRREELHEKWSKNNKRNEDKNFTEGDKLKYKEVLKDIKKHRELTKSLHLEDHKNLHRLMLRILGRLVGFVHHYERDVYFVVLAEIYESKKNCEDFFNKNKAYESLKKGRINAVVSKESIDREEWVHIKRLFGTGNIWFKRNDFSHFNMLQEKRVKAGKTNKPFPLTRWVNDARDMMKYDRKMKNSVAKSIQTILKEEGFTVQWQIDDKHGLCFSPKITVKSIDHLGDTKIPEEIHSDFYAKMVRKIL